MMPTSKITQIDITDDSIVKIYRHGKLIYEDPEIKVLFKTIEFGETLGTVSLEQWPECLVLWVGGKIVWYEQNLE